MAASFGGVFSCFFGSQLLAEELALFLSQLSLAGLPGADATVHFAGLDLHEWLC